MGYGSECCGPALGFRRFVTKAERVERLKEYQAALEREAQAVREKIQEIEKA